MVVARAIDELWQHLFRIEEIFEDWVSMAAVMTWAQKWTGWSALLLPRRPILTMCVMGAVVESDQAGNRKLNKAKATNLIGGAVALAMALTMDASCPRRYRSYLDDGSLLMLL